MQPGVKNQMWKKEDLLDRIGGLTKDQSIPFFVLTETHLKPHIKDAEIKIEGYSVLRSDRPERSQGGVAVYHKDDLSATQSMKFSNKTCEIYITQIVQMKVTIVAMYRPPDTELGLFKPVLEKVNQYLTTNSSRKNDIFIMGDLNFPNVNWETKKPQSKCSKNDKACFTDILRFMEEHFLVQTVDVPTRKQNILDVILTNSELVRKVCAEDTIMSDHKLVTCHLGYRDPTSKKIEEVPRTGFNALNLHKADWDTINEDLDLDWEEQLSDSNLQEKAGETTGPDNIALELGFKALTNIVLEICKNHAPPRSNRRKKKKCGHRSLLRKRKKMTKQLVELEKATVELEKATVQDDTKISKLKGCLVDIELEIRDAIKGQNKEVENEIIDQIKTNTKVFYTYANSFQITKQRIGPLENKTTKKLTNGPKEMADILAQQYVNVFSDPEAPIPRKLLFQQVPPTTIEDITFSAKDIEEAIEELQTHAASGPDDFPAIVLKRCKQTISNALYILWRKSLDTGVIPQYLLNSKIVPIFKKGDKTDAQNYRPVSLTSHLIKVFERVMRKALVKYIEKNNLLSRHQHGFRKSKSCVTQLLAHIDSILEMLSKGDNADVIYLDFAKAFDKVSHKILIQKLVNLGIKGKVLSWLRSFLSNRLQSVTVEGVLSFVHLVLSGVPQGTVLGPLLFIIFIDDIYEVIKHSLGRSFADDTRLTKDVRSSDDQQKLQEDLQAVIKWAAVNNMELHEGKFELLQHGRNEDLKGDSGHTYQLSNGQNILNSKTVKDLGVTIDESLRWSSHITEVTKQASQTSAWVLRTFATRQSLPLMTLYKSLVRSKMDYCCPVWFPTTKEEICALESVQRSFTSKIVSLRGLTYWERLQKLRLMSVQRRRERYILIHMWKIYTGTAPNDLNIQFHINDRTGPKCIVPKISTQSSKINTLRFNFFASMGPRLFNSLPKAVTDCSSPASFKHTLDDYIMSLPDTPPTPGYVAANNNSILDWASTSSRALPEELS